MIKVLDGDFGVGFDKFGGEMSGETADKEKNGIAYGDNENDDEKFVGSEESKIEEVAEKWNRKCESDDTENCDEE